MRSPFRSLIAVLAGFVVFSMLFGLLGRSIGGVLAALIAGVMSGYLTGKIALVHERRHGAITTLLAAGAMFVAPLSPPERAVLAVVAAAAVTAGAWVRSQAHSNHAAGPGNPSGPRSHS